jgi:signal transduction histidine kinase/CheY-like chemotaxis protein
MTRHEESILIVDDDPSVRAICERVLGYQGYTPILADSGHAALQLAREQAFDVALIDMNMPNLDGLETYRQLRAIQPDLIGVVVTGFGTLGTAIEALELGFSAFVTKPFSPQHLVNTVAQALARRSLARANERLSALLPLFELSRQMMSTTDLRELLTFVVRESRRETAADGSCLLLSMGDQSWRNRTSDPATVSPPKSARVPHVDYRQDPPQFLSLPTDAQQQLMADIEDRLEGADTMLLEGGALLSARSFLDPLIVRGVRCLLCVPLRIEGVSLGILCLMGMSPDVSFSEADRSFVTVLASQSAVAIQNARLLGEIQRAYDELKQLDHMKSEFISIASHELRTPLSHIMGYVGLLAAEVEGRAADYVEIIQAGAERLRDLMDDMLDLRHLELRTSALRLQQVCLQEMMERVLADIRPSAGAKRQSLSAVWGPEPICLAVDEEKLSSAIEKVLSNAVEFTPEGGTIEVSLLADGNSVRIGVQDTGVGIPAAAAEYIFEPFYQVEESLRRQHEGIGLGLTIARGMVELHGGRIDVDSEPGKGTLVTIWLPLRNGDW